VDSTLLARERSLQQDLNLEAGRQETLLAGPNTEAEVETGDRALEALTADLRQVEAAIKATSPRYAALALPEPLDLEAMRRQLDPGTMLLEYSLGPRRSYLWAITRKEITGHQLPGRAELDTAVRRLHALVSSTQAVALRGERGRPLAPKVPQREMLDVASALSRMLLGPVADRLGTQRLVIVADGILSYLPFGSLPDPVTLPPDGGTIQPLIVRHEIVSLPSLSVLAQLRQQPGGRLPPPRTIAVVADPVFYADDERVRRPAAEPSRPASPEVVSRLESTVQRSAEEAGARRDGERLARLPGTRKEADGILALMPDSAQTRRAVDFEASRAFATSGELSRYRYVHFATHGLLNSLHPELTAVVLSLVDAEGRPQDGFLRAHEIYNLQLPAEAVVLSACQTGLGREVKGEGLIGLTRGFLYAGAERVVVSLWSVDDEATAELMVRFYRGVMKGKPPAQALRTAQLEMWKGRRWQAPYYWAAFVLHGEWR
jgi:CHAT domain-containing protein